MQPLTPRPGLIGQWEQLVGPGATPAENGLVLGTALLVGHLVGD